MDFDTIILQNLRLCEKMLEVIMLSFFEIILHSKNIALRSQNTAF